MEFKDIREDFTSDVYNTLDFLPTNNEANRIIDSFDSVVDDVIVIPKGATNGDMLTVLFGENALITLDTHNYLKDWWNAPYGKERC